MECDKMRCKANYKGMCAAARSLRKETTYLSDRKHWETVAALHNMVRRIGNVAPISSEQTRANQIIVVRRNNTREIALFCRPQDTALREALAQYEVEAVKEIPSE